jgi:hypothetical protein
MLMKALRSPGARLAFAALLGFWSTVLTAGAAGAQVGALVSPGPLAKAHAQLEGIGNCQKCHEPGRKVSASKCLACHKPVAERIAAKKGVHRAVTNSCEGCHAEHAGKDAELRPLNQRTFDHAAETGLPLDGRHASIARDCVRCHKSRSFLDARPACASCHEDVHKGSLGATCSSCHTTAQPFAQARQQFDHSKAKFQLTGAHRTVECAKCHVNKAFSGLKFASCTDCHRQPHRQLFGVDCTSCHTTETWRTSKVDHGRTAFPLAGAHASAKCTACHVKPATQVRLQSSKCSVCHADVHKGGFKQDCASCHNTTSFKKAPFDHAIGGRFPLTGRHADLACARCHKSAATTGPARAGTPAAPVAVVFTGLSSKCATCHEDIHKNAAGPSCESCHTTSDFRSVSPYTHRAEISSLFAGRHATATCRACHAGPAGAAAPAAGRTPSAAGPAQWTFKGTPSACAKCHTDPHDAQLGAACERCHDAAETAFAASRFAHAATAFPLTGRHETVACRQCHTPPSDAAPRSMGPARQSPGRDDTGHALPFKGAGTACASCHKDVHLGQLGTRCETCHATSGFAVAKYAHKNAPAAFLAGQHATLACRACHKPESGTFPAGNGTAVRFVGSGTACASCHQEKDAHHGALGRDCERCHTPERWLSVSRAFHKVGLFPLEGRHLAVPCASCHWNAVTRGTPTKCVDCHWIRRQDDPKQTRLGTDCESCHRPTSWTAVIWSHAQRTGFVLNARHQTLACDSCHKDRRFMGGTVACASCHQQDYQRASQPNHAAAGFPLNCEVCHQPAHTSWTQAVFTHSSFALVGVHATQACASCHKNNVYKGTPRDCVGCHAPDYQKTTSPNHAAAGFPTACEQCHRVTASNWTGATFNHASYFPLVGLHAAQACSACHKNSVYKGTPRDCVGCHAADYQRTANPNHAAAGFPTTCEQCHQVTASGWGTGTFNHANVFPLVGLHATQACSACHKNGVYKGTPRDCVGCHTADYQRTTNPNHAAAGFPTTCEQCHQASSPSWAGAGFNHASVFPLVGVHATQACATCHKNGVYKGTPRDCVGCHTADYQRTTNPNHAAAGFPTACEQCHQASSPSWAGAGFNHASVFPLVGVHATQACATCHKNGVYKGTPRDCVGCHAADYQRTTNPNHAAAGFPTTCDQCHQASSSTWSSSFNHNQFYPLLGRHLQQSCSACHKNNVYKGTPTACVSCHLTKYQQTTNPNHTAAGFPTTCESCHKAGDSSWSQGTFVHSWFPITSGKHAGLPCTACHTTTSTYTVFSCTTACHARAQTDGHHGGVNGYRYDSAACYACHPNGRGGSPRP